MPGHQLPHDLLLETLEAYERHETKVGAAESLGIPRGTFESRLQRALALRGSGQLRQPKPFEAETLPSELPTAEELIERRKSEYARIDAAKRARKLINVRVRDKGPIGILHMGDPHVDDPGCDIAAIEAHVALINRTEGLYGANVGDNSNNWVGRLGRLYGEQATTAAESWVLVEWLISSVQWLYLIDGNHDLWSGSGNPIKWMAKSTSGVHEPWGARLNLQFPNGKQIRINARHDFHGHSQWNEVHGPKKAAKMGWRDHILTCGHKHTSGFAVDVDPATGLLSHIMRVAGYKVHDRYAEELGLPSHRTSGAGVHIIDPRYDDDDPRLITPFLSPEAGADYLSFLRRQAA